MSAPLLIEKYRRLLVEKANTLRAKRKVYTGSLRGERWQADTLALRYAGLVKVVEADGERPAATKDGFSFVGGNSHRLVYVREDVVERWLQVAGGDSHWAAASMLRPGKLAQEEVAVGWQGYRSSDRDTGLLAIVKPEDWQALLQVFDLPEDSLLAQVTVFDLEAGVSAKGTLRCAEDGEVPTVYPASWKAFGPIRAQYMAVLTTDAVYRPQAGLNAQELQYWALNRNRELAAWVWEAYAHAAESVLAERGSPWTPQGWLTSLGLSGSLASTVEQVEEAQRHGLWNLTRRVKLGEHLGLRAKSTIRESLPEGSVMLPREAQKYVDLGQRVVVSRNPALPSQDWQVYTVAGFCEGHYVMFSPEDRGWTSALGGDHDGDDAVVLYRSPVVGGPELGQKGLDLQAIKPNARKLGAGTVEDRLLRWENERKANIGVYDLLARRLASVGQLTPERADLLTTAIQVVIALKKRVATLEEQPWYPAVQELQKAVKPLVGKTDIDRQRAFTKGDTEGEFTHPVWRQVAGLLREGLALVDQRPRFSDTEEARADFGLGAEPHAWVAGLVQEYEHLSTAKAMAKLAEDGNEVLVINQRLKVLLHLEGPEVMLTLPEEEWKRSSRWLIAHAPTEVWVLWSHPEVLREFLEYLGAAKVRLVGPVAELGLQVGEVIEVEQEGLRVLYIDDVQLKVADETVYLPAGLFEVTAVSARGATLKRL
jgi:hypothetical protein